ncbi:MAG: hypothetical protein LC102_03630 [Ignavibacteriales bacterium]|nr:hypothetical protein [Ignavibacteria bacterium]MCZ2142504.1 hypothetical protein [Ignavibacteriales bacterium]WKZ72830.1 MAG: hypothetical protein QY308_01195 [Ignavibacteriaceae bacterium]
MRLFQTIFLQEVSRGGVCRLSFLVGGGVEEDFGGLVAFKGDSEDEEILCHQRSAGGKRFDGG